MIALYIVIGVVAVVGIVAFCIWQNNALQLTTYELKTESNSAQPLTIVHLSDLHGKRFGEYQHKLVDMVMAQSPDVICFTGDSVHEYIEQDVQSAQELFSVLVEMAPVLFVSGNHEREKGWQGFKQGLQNLGVTVMDNRHYSMGDYTFYGIGDKALRDGIDPVICPDEGDNIPQDRVNILLAHEPQLFKKYTQAGFDVALCGHAHGGQWRIPLINVGLFASRQGIFPKYYQGVHKKGKTQMVVSRGLSNTYFPVRAFNRPEVVVVKLNQNEQ